MQSNPVLHRLGFSKRDRVVIIHTDDIGMCQASVAAFKNLLLAGIISSGAVMVPCPWFQAAMELTRINPEVDLGVHLTFTSEWQSYRWGPISSRERISGMLDDQGYFFRTTAEAQERIDPAYAYIEMEAQIQRMIQAGFIPSHMDTHMGTVAHPKFMQAYVELALKYRLPLMMFRMGQDDWRKKGLDAETALIATHMGETLESMGVPLLDNMTSMPLERSGERLSTAKQLLADLPEGLTHFILHPAQDTAEIRAITPDWQARVADFETFLNEDLLDFINQEGIQVIGYRHLQKLMPI